jgi:cell division protein FtsI (penicillin-binding protein 3)
VSAATNSRVAPGEAKPTKAAVAPTPEELAARRKKYMRLRIVLLGMLVLLGGSFVLQRAYRLQVTQADELRTEAEAQQLRDVHLSPKRGTIYDRTGAELAVSVDVDSIFASPRTMHREGVDTESAATRLSQVLGVDRARIAQRLASDRYFVWIERQVTPEESAAVRALDIPGVSATQEAHRFYPNGQLGAHILGFSNVDGQGIEGVELALEEHLHGERADVPAIRDRRGRVVFSETLLDDRAAQGDDVYLTIDHTIQHVAERELELSIRTFEARAGSVVVMDPQSGEILAMASYPTFDPNDPGSSPADARRFRAITDRFEPGSTVKPFTIAAALAAGELTASEQIDCHNGTFEVIEGERPIHDTHPHGLLTPAEILAESSNIGAAIIGMRLGRPGLYRAFRRFGFGQTTGIPLHGETAGSMRHHSQWYERDLATAAFGQGVSVTALQLATAMGAIANGGRLMEPILVHRVVDGHGDTVEEALPHARRQVVPRSTARLVGDMLTAVTGEDGTGAEAAIPGYLVAGKTGTSQKADEEHGGYRAESDPLARWTASFVGFVPAESPRLVIAVIIDEPVIEHYGGIVAGPVFRRVGEASLRHLGVPPVGSGDALADIARQIRERAQLHVAALHAEEAHAEAEREPDAPVVEPTDDEARVPDLSGVTARGALVRLAGVGLVAELEGAGLVSSQTPMAGTIVPRGAVVHVALERPGAIEADVAPEADEATTRAATPSTPTHAAAPAPERAREERVAVARPARRRRHGGAR